MCGLMRGKRAKPSNLLYNILQYIRRNKLMIDLLTADNIINHYPFVRLMGSFKAAGTVGHTVLIIKLSCNYSGICIAGEAADFRLMACHMMAGFFLILSEVENPGSFRWAGDHQR